jgi:cytosine/adenosine deaminase-related metal-dependent hydrolase/dipeptidyl aminopeptidase/acylaminoacyl peptidase
VPGHRVHDSSFDLLGQLWTLPVQGGRAEPITNAVQDQSEDLDPAFAPDGASIVFRADRPGGRGLFRLSLADGEVQRITDQPLGAYSWSPDGRRLAVVQGRQLQLLDPAQADQPQTIPVEGLPRPPVSHPAWAPSGDRIALVNAPQGARAGGSLWEVPVDGGAARPLGPPDLQARSPAYAPDGGSLAFFAADSAGAFQVWVMDVGEEPAQLTVQEDVTPLHVRWLPDGSRLLYHAGGRLWTVPRHGGEVSEIPFTARVQLDRQQPNPRPVRFTPPDTRVEARGHLGMALAPGGERIGMLALGQLWVFEVGGTPRAVTSVPPTAAGLSWAPDERAVVWSAGVGGAEDLFATDLETGQTRQVTALPGSETAPAWSPDGAHIAFVHFRKPALTTPGWDYSDADHRLHVVPAEAPLVESTTGTVDLGETFSALGFFQPSQASPMWSSDSQELLYFEGPQATLVDLEGGRRRAQTEAFPTFASWNADGSVTYVEDGLLWRTPFLGDSIDLGEPARISDDPALYASTALDGSVLYVSSDGLRIRRPSGSLEQLGWPLGFTTERPDALLVRNVRVIPGTGAEPEEPVDLLIRNSRIDRIAAAGSLGDGGGATVLDAEGRTAIPGMIDLHSHLWDDAVLPAALFYGVTTVRDMGSTGLARLVGHRDAIEAGLQAGPRIITGGVQFWGAGRVTGGAGYQVSGDSARARAMSLMAAFGADYLKMRLFSGWADAAELVRAAHAQGWTTSGHVALPLPFIAAGADGMEHLGPSGLRTDEIVYDDVVQLFREAGMWVVPTVLGYASVPMVIDDPELLDDREAAELLTPFLRWWGGRFNPRQKPGYERFTEHTRTSARKLNEGGVTLAAGADVPSIPWAVHAELEELVESGLTPLEAITAATGTAAAVLGASEEIGTIAEGRWADVVILESDPLEDIGNTREIWHVIKGGVVVDRNALRRWTERATPARQSETPDGR